MRRQTVEMQDLNSVSLYLQCNGWSVHNLNGGAWSQSQSTSCSWTTRRQFTSNCQTIAFTEKIKPLSCLRCTQVVRSLNKVQLLSDKPGHWALNCFFSAFRCLAMPSRFPMFSNVWDIFQCFPMSGTFSDVFQCQGHLQGIHTSQLYNVPNAGAQPL